ncbi:MAG: hypothetical protein V1674_02815 [Candidatus Omnitrophota bacterium]
MQRYALRCVWEDLRKEAEKKELSALTAHLDQDPVLKKLWDDKNDAAYDKL